MEQLGARRVHGPEVAGSSPAAAIVQVRIQHHPARVELLEPLLAELPGAEVVTDPDPDSVKPSPWRTYQACLDLPVSPAVTHLLVLQDDVSVCRNLVQAAERVARAEPIALFLGGAPAASAGRAQRAPYGTLVPLVPADWVPVVALLWPVAVAQSFLDWCRENRLPGDPHPRSDDAVVGRWARRTRQAVYATTPSLVEHPDVERSLIGRKAGGGLVKWRVAHEWIGPEADPLAISWR